MPRTRMAVFYMCMMAIALALGGYHGDLQSWLPSIRALPSRMVLGVVSGLLVVLLSRLFQRYFCWAKRLYNEFQTALSNFGRRDAFVMASMSALGEELLFRGVIQGSFSNPVVGVTITAGVFAALHVGPSRVFLPWTLMAFVVGVMFGVLFWLSGDLLAPIIAHGVINFLNLRAILTEDDSRFFLGPLGRDPADDWV